MTVTLDSTTASNIGLSTSKSYSHTVGTANVNRGLFVCVMLKGQSGTPISSPTCTYNGVSMTKAGEYDSGGGGNEIVAIFYLANPATGSNTIALGWGGVDALGGTWAVSFYGVDQASPMRSGSFTSGTASISVPSNVGDFIIDATGCRDGFGETHLFTATAGQTVVINAGQQSTTRFIFAGGYLAGSLSSTTMSWTEATGDTPNLLGLAVKPASGAGGILISPSLIG